jgi:hypothetical protein
MSVLTVTTLTDVGVVATLMHLLGALLAGLLRVMTDHRTPNRQRLDASRRAAESAVPTSAGWSSPVRTRLAVLLWRNHQWRRQKTVLVLLPAMLAAGGFYMAGLVLVVTAHRYQPWLMPGLRGVGLMTAGVLLLTWVAALSRLLNPLSRLLEAGRVLSRVDWDSESDAAEPSPSRCRAATVCRQLEQVARAIEQLTLSSRHWYAGDPIARRTLHSAGAAAAGRVRAITTRLAPTARIPQSSGCGSHVRRGTFARLDCPPKTLTWA